MQLTLSDLRFHACHGVCPQEAVTGGTFVVNLTLTLDDGDVRHARLDDDLRGTVNYAEAYSLVRDEMSKPAALIERVAFRIVRAVLRSFPLVRCAGVRLTKVCPPITGFTGSGATVSLSLARRLIIWDFDGTIADTAPGIVRTMNATFDEVGLPRPDEAAVRATIGLPLLDSIERLAGLSGDALTQAAEVYHRLFEQMGSKGVACFEGVAEVIRAAYREGRTLAIATSRGHTSVEAMLTSLGLRDCFTYIVACEDVAAHKPDPEPVRLLCRMAHVDPAAAVVIGDTSYDIEMGRRAGAGRCIGVAWGNHSAEALRSAGATEVVAQAAGLTDL